MQKGKVAAQCGHAAMAAYAKTLNIPKLLKRWRKSGTAKIAVRVDSEEQLLELEKNAKKLNILTSVVRDAGQTQVAPGNRIEQLYKDQGRNRYGGGPANTNATPGNIRKLHILLEHKATH
ncbi:hypothetical protein D910_02439 [Dendroctonus ponderosae]|uniref:peptidyl-tRNA hydrolase n=1 Tax=Dendroctonus ponderosae TaxID=77166 RepID=U4U339_DENPD|nr:hypothetical protein D910_02439 [Dendroctonus ponderosae]